MDSSTQKPEFGTPDKPKSRPRTRLSPQKRREQLMEISMEVFASRGIGRGGHADIAEIANVSVATVFNYFPTREDLVDDVLQFIEYKYSNFLSDCIDLDRPIKENLNCIANSIIQLVKEDCSWLKVWFEWSASTRSDVWPLFLSSNQTNLKLLENMFKAAIERQEVCDEHEPRHIASLFHGMMYSLFLQANRAEEGECLDTLTDNYLRMLCIYK
ncbi:TetR family transcriptional regulator [Vibrio sp. WXL103]|uniref:TetR family transcriptional regulator n=1 Tax=unclassified Vibrio TaxID=2614977 RepID=UPI003EC706EF